LRRDCGEIAISPQAVNDVDGMVTRSHSEVGPAKLVQIVATADVIGEPDGVDAMLVPVVLDCQLDVLPAVPGSGRYPRWR
jgi:hypothetical protein